MNEFYLCNKCSINLNFIIYINNLYDNLYNDKNKFPYIFIEKDALLSKSIVFDKLKNLWKRVFESNKLLENDMDLWINKEFKYDELFSSTSYGVKAYKYVLRSYEAWYWNTGNSLCNKFSDNLVEIYYNNILKIFEMRDECLPTGIFALQVVYDNIPKNWECNNNRLIYICPEMQLPSAEEAFNTISEI